MTFYGVTMPQESRSGAMARRNRLGKILVKKEVIDQHQLEEAMRLQERENTFLGQILVEKGWGTEEEITEAISDSLHLNVILRRAYQNEVVKK